MILKLFLGETKLTKKEVCGIKLKLMPSLLKELTVLNKEKMKFVNIHNSISCFSGPNFL